MNTDVGFKKKKFCEHSPWPTKANIANIVIYIFININENLVALGRRGKQCAYLKAFWIYSTCLLFQAYVIFYFPSEFPV